jgi:hypothetical protein
MNKIRIQKLSNGHFCTAAQWLEDVIKQYKDGSIEKLSIGNLVKDPLSSEITLEKMIEKYPLVSASLKIVIKCRLAMDIFHTKSAPYIKIHDTQISVYVTQTYGTLEEVYADCDKVLLEHIQKQRDIVALHNSTEI